MSTKKCIDCGHPFVVYITSPDASRCVGCSQRENDRRRRAEYDTDPAANIMSAPLIDFSTAFDTSYDSPSTPDTSSDYSSGGDFGGGGGFDGGGSSDSF